MRSGLYEGTVRHRRHAGRGAGPAYEFRHRLFMAYVDLGELAELEAGRLCSSRRPALARFRRSDHLGDPAVPLEESVRSLVQERTGSRPDGPIGLLTHLRCFGHNFNPVSFYWCFEAGGEHVQAVVAHVTSTPWGESHSYVLDARASADHGSARLALGSFQKELHVSPLMGMGHTYELRVAEPGERVSVHISSAREEQPEQPFFDATLSLARREWSPAELRRLLARYPLQTVAILVRIYSHALRLRLRGATYHPRPSETVAA
ncbi:MAG TPA: DUF1365 domain-containing protein [Solirubrobacteraceae bacterium]|nr:DUF1365 domain-containing protein [Solirubrobacteraceae bacterium]